MFLRFPSWPGAIPIKEIAALVIGLMLQNTGRTAPETPPDSSSRGDVRSAEASEQSASLDGPTLDENPNWSEAIQAVLFTAIPDQYEDLSHWGQTNEVFDGVRIRQRGFNIRVEERKRKVNHGAWYRYKLELVDKKERLRFLIEKIEPVELGVFRFQFRLISKVRSRIDFEHWVLGIKGLNLSTVAESDVEVIGDCHVKLRTESNSRSLFPDVVIDPKVDRVQLFLRDLKLKRLGEIRGDIAREIGAIARHDLENLLQAQEGRVVRKANEAIEKKRASLRFTPSRLW